MRGRVDGRLVGAVASGGPWQAFLLSWAFSVGHSGAHVDWDFRSSALALVPLLEAVLSSLVPYPRSLLMVLDLCPSF